MTNNPRILIGIGTCDFFKYCEKKVFKQILEQQTQYNFDILIVDNSKKADYYLHLKQTYHSADIRHLKRPQFYRDAVGQARKCITDYARINRYDYLLFVDADMVIPLDTLEKLMTHKKEFVTAAIGYDHNHKGESTCYTRNPEKKSMVPGLPALTAIKYSEMSIPPFLVEISACGLSCCLIDTRILPGMNFYVSHVKQAFMEDIIFCRDLLAKDIELWADKSIRPIHLHRINPKRNGKRAKF